MDMVYQVNQVKLGINQVLQLLELTLGEGKRGKGKPGQGYKFLKLNMIKFLFEIKFLMKIQNILAMNTPGTLKQWKNS